MYGFVLQDWTTIRMQFGQASFNQSESSWVSLQPYSDIAFWLEVREATLATGVTTLQFNYQTAPMKDESLFATMISSATFTGAIVSPNTPDVKRVLLASNPTVPLARWVRWQLAPNAVGTAGVSDVTFRICCAANAVGVMG
ncbi:MAG: hypothetical protein U0235_30150 [Polyangiaceae bacterium]